MGKEVEKMRVTEGRERGREGGKERGREGEKERGGRGVEKEIERGGNTNIVKVLVFPQLTLRRKSKLNKYIEKIKIFSFF